MTNKEQPKINLNCENEAVSFKSILCIVLALLPFTGVWVAGLIALFGNTLLRTLLLISLVYQYTLAKRQEWYRNLLKSLEPESYFKNYSYIEEAKVDNSRSLFAFHPHGVFSIGPVISKLKNKQLYDSVILGSRFLVNIPFGGIFVKWMGTEGVNNENFKKTMESGTNISFVPGGFEEATLTCNDRDRVFIKSRKGFIKYALQYGYKVYPIFSFGENRTYHIFNIFENFRLFLNKIKIPACLFYGKFFFYPIPHSIKKTVVGNPLVLPIIKDPKNDEVDYYHSLYIKALQEVYDRHKVENKSLEIN